MMRRHQASLIQIPTPPVTNDATRRAANRGSAFPSEATQAEQRVGPIISHLLEVIRECVEYLDDMKSLEDLRRLRKVLKLRSERSARMLMLIVAAEGGDVSADQLARETIGSNIDGLPARKMVRVYIHDVRRALRVRWPSAAIHNRRNKGYSLETWLIQEIRDEISQAG